MNGTSDPRTSSALVVSNGPEQRVQYDSIVMKVMLHRLRSDFTLINCANYHYDIG